jgi:hypothetical protein
MRELTIVSCSGDGVQRWIPDLARLRLTVFRDYPYLYDGTLEYEQNYLKTYTQSPDALVLLALDGDAVVGASTGIPMAHETDEFKEPFVAAGYDPASIFYCGESVLLASHRGRGVYSSCFSGRENHARRLGMTWCVFCGVKRPENHPLRPANYTPLDGVWRKFGYTPHPELCASFAWKDVGQPHETPHEMMFWMKKLGEAAP